MPGLQSCCAKRRQAPLELTHAIVKLVPARIAPAVERHELSLTPF